MPNLVQLWLPILVSAAAVFFVSSLIHMVLRYHNADYRRLPNEEGARKALREPVLAPGQYVVPHCVDPAQARDPEHQRRFVEGPVAVLWVRPNGMPALGSHLLKWFLYCVVVGVFVAYLGSVVLPKGSAFLTVFRVCGTIAFLAYAGAKPSDTIWKGKPVSCLVKEILDGALYALAVGATFGWLWPA